MFQDRKVLIKTMKTYIVKFATVSSQCCSSHSLIETSCQYFVSSLDFRKDPTLNDDYQEKKSEPRVNVSLGLFWGFVGGKSHNKT